MREKTWGDFFVVMLHVQRIRRVFDYSEGWVGGGVGAGNLVGSRV